MSSQVTILNIAEECGLSKSAVAYVLNGTAKGRVSQKNQELVKKTAKQLGYRPNLVARGLRTRQSYAIGILLPSPADMVCSYLIANLQAKLATTPYTAIHAFWADESAIGKATHYILDRQVDAIITCEPSYLTDDVGVPVVSYHNFDERFDFIGDDAGHTMHEAVEYLTRLGHTRIGYIGSLQKRRWKALRKEIETRGLPFRPEWQIDMNHHISVIERWKEGAIGLEELWAHDERPTAVLCHNDVVASGVIGKAQEMGICIPKELSVIGYDNLPYGAFLMPSLTSFDCLQQETSASLFLEMIFSRIEDPTLPIRREYLKPKLIVRNSTGPTRFGQ